MNTHTSVLSKDCETCSMLPLCNFQWLSSTLFSKTNIINIFLRSSIQQIWYSSVFCNWSMLRYTFLSSFHRADIGHQWGANSVDNSPYTLHMKHTFSCLPQRNHFRVVKQQYFNCFIKKPRSVLLVWPKTFHKYSRCIFYIL